MAFSLTSEKRVSRSEEIKTTPSVDSKGALAVTDASTAEAAPSAKPIASDAAARVAVSARSEFVLAKCMPIYWEEKVSEPVDLFDKDGTKTGYKIVTTGAGYTITNIYNLAGRLATTEYQSMYGDWSATLYEYSIISEDGQQQNRVTSSGKSGEYTWSSYEISDIENNLLESRFENSDGYKSSTTQTYSKAADGSIEKIVVKSTGSGSTYTYESYAEYDATWNLLKSAYSDGNGYSSSTDRIAIVDAAGSIEAYSITSKGFGAGGYWYESTETLDKNNNLIANTYKDSSGYFSQRTSSRQEDPDWGEVIVTKDISGNDDGTEKASYTSTAKYTLDWRTIESEHADSNGYSSKLTTSIKINPSGEKIYSQTYQFKYLDSITSEWTTEYNEQWWPIVDGKPVEQPPVLWKTPVAADAPPPKTIPVVEKSAVDDFQTTAKSSSDTVSEKAITGVAGQSDKLKGSAGDDVFIVNDRADKIVSGQKGNSDSVMSEKFSLDLRASKWDGIEHAMLTGSENLNLVGDAGSNLLSGNGANNVLRGGAGADTLFGGGGDDVFVIAKEKTVDTIIDFVPGADKIALSGSYFKSLFDKSMHLKDGVIGERLILDSQGSIWFDIDGAGRKSPVQIGIIGGIDKLDKADFIYML